MIKIALLHISRQRAGLAIDCFKEWMGNCANPKEIEYILGVDDDDPNLRQYETLFSDVDRLTCESFIFNVTDSRNGVQALNNAAKEISDTTEVIISVSDDMGCFKNWDLEVLKLLEDVDNFKEPKFIGVSDGLNPYGGTFVFYLSNRAHYDRFGWVLCPEYDGMWADNDMTQLAKKTGALIDAPHLLFQHKHYSLGLSPYDQIYEKTNNPREFKKNEQIFLDRQKRNFDL